MGDAVLLTLAESDRPDLALAWWGVIAAGLGAAAGYKGVYDRFGSDAAHLVVDVWGVVYLITRTLVPLGVFLALQFTVNKDAKIHPALLALTVGVGAEAALRTQFVLKKDAAGNNELKGLFDLLDWYESMFLDQLQVKRAAGLTDFIEEVVPLSGDFPALCAQLKRVARGYPQKDQILEAVNDAEGRFEHDAAKDHDDYALSLAYEFAEFLGKKELRGLFESVPAGESADDEGL